MAIFNEGRLKLKFKPLSLNDLVASVLSNFEINVSNKNGELKTRGFYKEGKEDGTWELFNEQGQLKAKINYRMGIKMKTEKFE